MRKIIGEKSRAKILLTGDITNKMNAPNSRPELIGDNNRPPGQKEGEKMGKNRTYGAIADRGRFYVATLCLFTGQFRKVGHIRSFNNWDEANGIAQECATGKHNCYKGRYINMR